MEMPFADLNDSPDTLPDLWRELPFASKQVLWDMALERATSWEAIRVPPGVLMKIPKEIRRPAVLLFVRGKISMPTYDTHKRKWDKWLEETRAWRTIFVTRQLRYILVMIVPVLSEQERYDLAHPPLEPVHEGRCI